MKEKQNLRTKSWAEDFLAQGLALFCFHFSSAELVSLQAEPHGHATFFSQLCITASSHLPSGFPDHPRPAAPLPWRQDRETKPCLLPMVQAEAGPHHWGGCGPDRGCHNLPFMAFCKTPAGFEHGVALSCCKNLSCPGKVRSLLLSVPLVQL